MYGFASNSRVLFCFSELTNAKGTLLAMLSGKVNSLPNHIQSVYVQNILKILSVILKNESPEEGIEVNNSILCSKKSSSRIFHQFFSISRCFIADLRNHMQQVTAVRI